MQHARIDLLRLAHIPEILPEITAGAARHIHLCMVFIPALRALPRQIFVNLYLPVKTAYMAVIRLCVKLRILYIIIYEFYNFFQRLKIMAHIRDFHIGDSTARGNYLELALKLKF